jgi:hypothetical protein
MPLDGLRPPQLHDREASLYKDWLHLDLFDWQTGLVGLVNVALHGAPYDPRSCAVGTALMHLPGRGWLGNVETTRFDGAAISEEGVGLRGVALAIDPRSGRVMASARLDDDGLRLDVSALLGGPTYSFPKRLPLGSGWISWFAAPHLRPNGKVELDGERIELSGAVAYHDHNWGRWRWGDDLGWEWGCFADRLGRSVVVFTRVSDRDHRRHGRPLLLVHAGGHRHTFVGRCVTVEYVGRLAVRPRRVPGALAALHGDRAQPRLPAEVVVSADDGRATIRLRFRGTAVAQVVTTETAMRGYGFIHEIAGDFEAEGTIAGQMVAAEGLGMFEHVD